MNASQAPSSADSSTSSSVDVREETVRTVSVQFKLYDNLSGIANRGAFKAEAPKRGGKKAVDAGEEPPPKSDTYWIYLFQYSHWTQTVLHTHELYVDELGRYNLMGGATAPKSVVAKSVVLTSSHTRGNERFGIFLYYALLSPFRMPKSRLDSVIPSGVASGTAAKKFIGWAQYRELPLLQFSRQHERLGATVELWTPWLKAAAIADSWEVTYRRFAKDCFARHDRQRIVDTIDLLKGCFDVDKCTSRVNIDAFRADVKRDWAPCDAVSAKLAKHINGKPFQEMLLDMWEDKTGDALTVLLPWLADSYRAAAVRDLVAWADPRLFEIPIKIEGSYLSKAIRRATKALVEINSLLFKALESDPHGPYKKAAAFVEGAQSCFRTLFGKEVAWTNFGWDRAQIEDLKRLTIRGDSPAWKWRPGATSFLLTVIWALDSVGSVKAYQALQKDPHSQKARIALIGSCASQLSTTLKIIESVTTPSHVLDARDAPPSSVIRAVAQGPAPEHFVGAVYKEDDMRPAFTLVFSLLLASIGASGCAMPPPTCYVRPTPNYRFGPPAPGMAQVIFVNPMAYSGGYTTIVEAPDARFVGVSNMGFAFARQIPPGEHVFVADGEGAHSMRLNVVWGRPTTSRSPGTKASGPW